MKGEIVAFEPSCYEEWLAWLRDHYDSAPSVWLVYRKTEPRNLSWGQAVDAALCVGWIDSKVARMDAARYRQYFCPRKPGSVWSRVNQRKVEHLEAAGKMLPAGRLAVQRAKADGSWSLLDAAEDHVVPPDLAAAFAVHPGADGRFAAFPASAKRNVLQWILTAKRSDTRARRVEEAAASAGRGRRPRGF